MVILKKNVRLIDYWEEIYCYSRFVNHTNMTTSEDLVLWMSEREYDLINIEDAVKELGRTKFIGKKVLCSFRNLIKRLVEENIITDDAEQSIKFPYSIEWERRTFEVAKDFFVRNVAGMNEEVVALAAINHAKAFITNYKNSLNQCLE